MNQPDLILRYSDRERDSIVEHKAIVDAKGAVWWGWWKKVHEAMPPPGVLPYGPLDPPLEIGLLQRKPKEMYWLARCTAIVGLEGQPVASPERDQTPDYYGDDRFPAWFRFEDFQPLTREAFAARFSGIPEGDPTLYWVVEEKGTRALLPALQPERLFPSDGTAVLHLSDLHFGEMHAFGPGWGDGHSMVDIVADYVEQVGTRVGVVVVSGDLISKGHAASYDESVVPALETLLERLDLGKEHMIIVPGNHDILLENAVDRGTRKYEHEQAFRQFMNGFYGGDVEELESLTRYETSEGWTLAFVGLNSVRLRDTETKEFGYVGHRSEPWLRRLAEANRNAAAHELAQERRLNFVVLHHHLLPATREAPAQTPVSVTVDAARIVEDCEEHAVHVCLHGHQHYPFVANTSRLRRHVDGRLSGLEAPVWVLGGGSAGARAQELTDQLRQNSFALYEPQEDVLQVDVLQYNPSEHPTSFASLKLPLTT